VGERGRVGVSIEFERLEDMKANECEDTTYEIRGLEVSTL
jgi:hypothetical protein